MEETAETRLSVLVEILKSAELEEMKASDMLKKETTLCATDEGLKASTSRRTSKSGVLDFHDQMFNSCMFFNNFA